MCTECLFCLVPEHGSVLGHPMTAPTLRDTIKQHPLCVYVCVCVCVCVRERERGGEGERERTHITFVHTVSNVRTFAPSDHHYTLQQETWPYTHTTLKP